MVLLLENDFRTRCTAAAFLRAMNYQVIEGENADDGMSVLSTGTHVDVVFTAVRMPGSLDGLAFAEWVVQRYPFLPVVLTSAAPAAELEIPTAPQRRFVRKPCYLFDVEREIRALL